MTTDEKKLKWLNEKLDFVSHQIDFLYYRMKHLKRKRFQIQNEIRELNKKINPKRR